MKTVLVDMLTSKKLLAAAAAAIAYLVGRFGLHVDPDAMDRVFEAFVAYVVAQGVADHGKSAAMINAVNTNSTSVSATDTTRVDASKAVSRMAGTMSLLVVLLLGVTQTSCAAVKAKGATAAGAFLDCESADLKAAADELVGLAKPALMSTITGAGHVDSSSFKAALSGVKGDAARCAVNAAVAMLLTPAPAKPAAVMAAPLEVDAAELRAAYAAAMAQFGWPQMAVR